MTTTSQTSRTKGDIRDTRPPSLIAYHVTERGEQSFWTRLGAAWDHDDAKGLTIQLDLMPISDGRIILREPSRHE